MQPMSDEPIAIPSPAEPVPIPEVDGVDLQTIDVNDLIDVFQQRDAQARRDIAARDALIMRLAREKLEAVAIVDALTAELATKARKAKKATNATKRR